MENFSISADVSNQYIEKIKTAVANKSCIKMTYKGKIRTIEPYSLRQSKQGNITLYGLHKEDGAIKAFSVSKMSDLEIMPASEVTSDKPKRGRPKGSKKIKAEASAQGFAYSKPVLAAFNKQVVKSNKPKAKLGFIKGGNYDDLEWYRLRMKKNKDNEARLKAERLKKNDKTLSDYNIRK